MFSRVALVALAALSLLVSLAALPRLVPVLRASGTIARALEHAVAYAAVASSERAVPSLARLSNLASCGRSCSTSPATSVAVLDDRGLPFGLLERGADGSDETSFGESLPDVRASLRGERGPLLWARERGEIEVVRDPELVARAQAAVESVRELGREMGRVGREMGRLGAQEGRLGALASRLGMLEARVALSDDEPREADRARLAALRTQIVSLKARLKRADAEPDLSDLGRRISELSRREQEALAKARAEIRAILDEASRTHRLERLGIGA